MGNRLYPVPVALFAAGVLAAGCGSSGSSDPLTKAEFVQQANSICRENEAERSEGLRNAAGADPELTELTTEALQPVQNMAEELGELSPPAGDATEISAIVEAFETGIADVKADPADPTAVIAAFGQANKLAGNYGLVDCAI